MATGQQAAGLQTMEDAADAEDATEKHPVTPGQLAPARELYGAMLLQAAQADGLRWQLTKPRCTNQTA